MEVKWAVYLFITRGLLIFNLDFNQLSFLVCTEEIAGANEQQRTIIYKAKINSV